MGPLNCLTGASKSWGRGGPGPRALLDPLVLLFLMPLLLVSKEFNKLEIFAQIHRILSVISIFWIMPLYQSWKQQHPWPINHRTVLWILEYVPHWNECIHHRVFSHSAWDEISSLRICDFRSRNWAECVYFCTSVMQSKFLQFHIRVSNAISLQGFCLVFFCIPNEEVVW